jgi:hypothetical protein
MRFARLIDRPVRVLGLPSARAAFGGNLSLLWLPRIVVHARHRDPGPLGATADASAHAEQYVPAHATAASVRVNADWRYAVGTHRCK